MTPRQRFILLIGFMLVLHTTVFAQSTLTSPQEDVASDRLFTLYGDLRVIEWEGEVPANTMFDLLVYSRGNVAVARQRVGKGGRYSFNNIVEGNYFIAVELDNVEISRVPIHIAQRKHKPIRQDLELEWTRSLQASRAAMSARDSYSRNPQNRKLFDKAMKQINKNELPEAIATLRSIVEADPKDHQSWNELGLVYFIQKDFTAAEGSYAKAIEVKPEYITAFLGLGRMQLAQKNNEGAIAAFQSALERDSKSALANYFLGEAYLAAGKQSIAVGYLNEALKLDPVGMTNAHLRLAYVYNLSGRKDLAALEYNEFLKKKADHPDAQRMREYIRANNPRMKRSADPSPSPSPKPTDQPVDAPSSTRMPDGKQWMTQNLNLNTDGSYCYDEDERNCRRYGRLYKWESAKQSCQSLGDGWRLPTNDEWQLMVKHFGGVRDDSADNGKEAFKALSTEGSSGFNVLFGGRRNSDDGQYARLEAHGFYWTASESDPATAWFYNFGQNGRYLNRHSDGNKQTALSVRCVRE